jgi:hypothetical protein
MTTRRTFLQSAALVSSPLVLEESWAASSDPSKLALVIGNSAYRDAPLVNPTNDAKAVTGLLGEAGFTIHSHLNANRADMLGAMERFGNLIKRSETKLVVFYYAGHGAQLDWRNYLLPVDAAITKQDDIKNQCVDLNRLIGLFGAAKDKTFVVILDACRDNPFGTTLRPDQKGLSQFDAPVGSLLAYATSPGSVAADGVGQNGLYTENLVRELSQHGTRMEDALKRVRLNVRLASKGAQIPWETTSLENDVFIFNEGQRKLSEGELEKLIEADITEWARIKSSLVLDDWVGYLRKFPNGRFAEIAQMRLSRLLAAIERAQAQAALEERKRVEQQHIEDERIRVAQAQRLEAERQQLELEQQRLKEQQALALQRQQEQERLEREKVKKADAARVTAQRRKQDDQRLLAERQRAAQEKLERERVETERIAAAEKKKCDDDARRVEEERVALAKGESAVNTKSGRLVAQLPQVEGVSIDIGPRVAMPMLFKPSANPFSAGRYPLGRIFTVGDSASYLSTDVLTGIERRFVDRVTKVDYEEDRVEFNQGKKLTDLMGNFVRNANSEYDAPRQLNPAELQIGKRWNAVFSRTKNGEASTGYYSMHVAGRETLRMSFGDIDTFRIKGQGWRNQLFRNRQTIEIDMWLVPGLNFPVRVVESIRTVGTYASEKQELISLHQQVFHSA